MKWMTWRRALAMGLGAGLLLVAGLLVLRFKRSCVFNGKRYYSGETVPSPSPCNTWWCEDGVISGSLIRCEVFGPRSECYERSDALHTADWRAWADFRELFPGQAIQGSEILHMEESPLYWLFQMRTHSADLPPKVGSIWVLKDHCQSGVSERNPLR